MLPKSPNQNARRSWLGAIVLAFSAVVAAVSAADTNAPPPMSPQDMFEGGTNTYANWIEFSTGGFVSHGNKAQMEEQRHVAGGAFGGISDLHYTTNLDKTTTLTLDGRALFDQDDYKLRLDVTREKTGYVRLTYRQYRVWYNGDGGFYPPTDMYYSAGQNALGLDSGQLSLEMGWTPEKGPQVIFKYTHDSRNGEKEDTSWGFAHPGGSVVRGISPASDTIHEHTDSFDLEVTDHIKTTELGAGLRVEAGKLNDALHVAEYPGEPIQQAITDRQGTTYDLFDFHTSTETWLKPTLMLSSGFSYSHLNDTFSGSRIYGSDFDVGYVPSAQSGFGYLALNGGSILNEYVADLNLFYKPAPGWTITPSLRGQKEDWDTDSGGLETLGGNTPVPFASANGRALSQILERLDVNYNGITNWALYSRADMTEESGTLNQNGGVVPVGGIGVPPVLSQTFDNGLFQKYSAGARWYPARGVTLDAGGYYKLDEYHYENSADSTPNNSGIRYPAYLVMQSFQTYDGNVRLTLRPWPNVMTVSRYEFQRSTIETAPDPISGLSSAEASKMNSHIIAQDVTWTPWSRLSLQGGLNYVLSETKTPASDVTQSILNAQNNYWTVNLSSDFIIDNKSDLLVSYFYYRADDYTDNALAGSPFGAGGHEQSVTATLTRRLTDSLRLSIKYGYVRYEDIAYGGNRDFGAHLIYANLRYRF